MNTPGRNNSMYKGSMGERSLGKFEDFKEGHIIGGKKGRDMCG